MTKPSEQAFDPFATFVQLREGGGATALTWTPDFWRKLQTRDGDRVVGAKRALEPADFHVDELEMHPEGDELLYLLTGEVDVLLEENDGERMIRLRGGQGCIVPRGVWHRLILRQPSELLFVTPPRGTQLRPVATTERA
jgi:oxalate decarboxylase/phosphoglucose isomerase-like protein (cupin superfamily)